MTIRWDKHIECKHLLRRINFSAGAASRKKLQKVLYEKWQGPKPKDEDAGISAARRIIGTLRSMAMEGSFGNQKQHMALAV